MWETFSQRLSISIIHAFIIETACVNNSKKELDYYRNLSQISLIIMQQPPLPPKALNWLDYSRMVGAHIAIGTISNYPHIMGNYRGCCSLRGHTLTLMIASMRVLVLATAPPLLCVGGRKYSGPRKLPTIRYNLYIKKLYCQFTLGLE